MLTRVLVVTDAQGREYSDQYKMVYYKIKDLFYHLLSPVVGLPCNADGVDAIGTKISREVYTKGRKIHFLRANPVNP
jgi:hypothetical protein